MEFLDTRAADSVETSKYDHSRHAQVISSAQARLPIHFFTIGILSLACVGLAAVVVMPAAVRFFYQPKVLALVHTLTLGVITAVMMGVMYRYVPALLHRPISFSRLAYPQLLLFVAGVVGMIAHFAIGNWVGLWWSAAAVLLSVALFTLCLLPILWPRLARE